MRKLLSTTVAICLVLSMFLGCFSAVSNAESSVTYSDEIIKYVEEHTEGGQVRFGVYWTPQYARTSVEQYAGVLQKYVDAGITYAVTGNEKVSETHLSDTVQAAKLLDGKLDIWFDMGIEAGLNTQPATFGDAWYKYLIVAYLGLDYYEKPWDHCTKFTQEQYENAGDSSVRQGYLDMLWEENKDNIDHDALAALYITDEPAMTAGGSDILYSNYSKLAAKLEQHNITTPVGINFFPIYACGENYNGSYGYSRYLDMYLLNGSELDRSIFPDFAGYSLSDRDKARNNKINVDWLMYDCYISQGDKNVLHLEPFFVNQFYMMNYAQYLNVPIHTFVNIINETGGALYSPSRNQLLENVHLNLMLGGESVCYFLGWPENDSSHPGKWTQCMLDQQGNATTSYYNVKNANTKVNGMKGVFLNFKNKDGVVEVNGTDVSDSLEAGGTLASRANGASRGNVVKYNKKSTEALASATGDHAYIGLFTKEDSTDEGFYVLNADYTDKTSTNVLNFTSEKYYQVWGANGLEAMGKASSLTVVNDVADAKFVIVSDTESPLVEEYYDSIVEQDPSTEKNEDVVNVFNKIISYLEGMDNLTDESGSDLVDGLKTRLAAYEADPRVWHPRAAAVKSLIIDGNWTELRTKAPIYELEIYFADEWLCNGKNRAEVYFNPAMYNAMADLTSVTGEPLTEFIGFAKIRTDLLFENLFKVEDSHYIGGNTPAKLAALTPVIEKINSASTAKAVYEAVYEAIGVMNENCSLQVFADAEAAIAAAREAIAVDRVSADGEEKEIVEASITAVRDLIDSSSKAGFWQVRGAGWNDSFVEDIEETETNVKAKIANLAAAVSDYNKLPMPIDIVKDKDGEIRAYKDGVAVYAGLVKDANGNMYYVNSTKKAVKNTVYDIGEAKANGLMPAGTYYFDAEGKLAKDGLVEVCGEIRYFVNGTATYPGLVRGENGAYYYVNSAKKAVKNCTYDIGEAKTNGLMPAGTYQFGADGRMIITNGLSFDADGEIRYYENGVAVYKGLVKDVDGSLYYINSTLKAVKNVPNYAIGEAKMNGITDVLPGVHSFGEDGKLVS